MRKSLLVAALVAGALRADTYLVLPFFNQSKTANLDWIGESVAESVADSLSSEGLLVLDRADRLEAYRRLSLRPGAELTHASVIRIGQALDASKVIFGYYEVTSAPGGDHSQSSLRIDARILDLKQMTPGGSYGEVGPLDDIARLEAQLGWQTLDKLRPGAAPSESAFLQARPPVRIDAVESYIRGLLAASPEQRQRLFLQAARIDANYSQPCFQLGKGYWEKKDYKSATMWLEKVSRADPHYLEAQFFLGLCRYAAGNFAGAEQAFQSIAATLPLNEVFNNLGAAQDRRNDTASAISSYQKALEGDSADPDFHFNLGYTLWRAGQYAAASESFRAVLARNPEDAEAALLLDRASKAEGPRPGEAKMEQRERIKTNYEETAYRQLQALLTKK